MSLTLNPRCTNFFQRNKREVFMIEEYLLLAAFLLNFIFIITLAIWIFKITKKQRKELKNNPPQEADIDEPQTEPIVKTVKVIDQYCGTKVVGVKQPKAIEEFFITFQEIDGNIFNLAVPKECYDGFEIGQEGKLSVVNGELYGFKLNT